MNLEIEKVFLTNEFESEKSTTLSNSNTDVIVRLTSGEKYIASFFTYSSIEQIRKENLKSGAFLDGKYYWNNNMLLIDNCSKKNIALVVQDLLNEGDFNQVFKKI